MDMQQPFWLADWLVDPASCRIKRGEIEVKLEPKVMMVLTCLAQNAGQVISREELEAEVWKDMVVGYDSLASTIIKLRKAFGDDSKNPQIIETVPKRGYRLKASTRQTTIQDQGLSSRTPASAGIVVPNTGKLKHIAILASIVTIIALLVSFWPSRSGMEQLQRTRPSIAVLPFKNLSSDPDQEYFSDGMTADIITDLSKISGISVISRNSVFTYKDIDIDIKELGKTLGVSYVLEGSVQKSGSMVRISARLIDTNTSHTLWANRFDGNLGDVFSLQDNVTNHIVTSLAIKLTENERRNVAREYTKSIEAYDEFLKGWQLFWIFSRESNHRARDHFNKAIKLDSQFARAYANLALTHTYDYLNAWKDDIEESKHTALDYARKAVELDPGLPQVHWVMGLIHMFNKDYQSALEAAQKTLDYDPNSADGHGLMSTILNYAGKPEQALGFMKTAMSLNPHHPSIYIIIRGEIHFNLHEYDKAIQYFEAALGRNPEAQEARLWLAAAYALSNRPDDAEWQLEHIRQDDSLQTLDHIERVIPFRDPAQRRHLLNGLHKAGLDTN